MKDETLFKVAEMTGDPDTICVEAPGISEFYWRLNGVRKNAWVYRDDQIAPWHPLYSEAFLERAKQKIDLANRCSDC